MQNPLSRLSLMRDQRHAQSAAWKDQLEAQRDFTLHHNSGPGGNDYAANKAFSDMHQGLINKPGAFQYKTGNLDYSDTEHSPAWARVNRPGTPQYDTMMRSMTPQQRGDYRAAGDQFIQQYNATHGEGPSGFGSAIMTIAKLGLGAGFGAMLGGGLLGPQLANIYNNPLSQIARLGNTAQMFRR